jgi:hypothetical protein
MHKDKKKKDAQRLPVPEKQRWALRPTSVMNNIGLSLMAGTSAIGLKRAESDIIGLNFLPISDVRNF